MGGEEGRVGGVEKMELVSTEEGGGLREGQGLRGGGEEGAEEVDGSRGA